ncbi:N-6 DNA methylase [Actinomadura chibensis]|uniref:N-6 DNA methylase n=1 Tax=Actinomadura chibensis TaxID=392828 RepID=A0A5D0NS41_9ACTN|nr:N-6 DNA methylase [Actinomadura chibensis]
MTAAEISRLAGVTRATVSNWRRRHPDFPQPTGGTEASPSYDRRQVEAWLAARGRLLARSAADDLRERLRGRPPADVEAVALFTAHLAGLDETGTARAAALPDGELARTAAGPAADVPAELLRTALDVVLDEGPLAVFAVLDEHAEAPIGIRGTHPTPPALADLMAELATAGNPRARSVFDPACGGGHLLAAAAARLGGGARAFGQEYRPVTAAEAIARVAETAPGTAVTVRSGDSLRADAFPDLRADAVVCNPPYGDRDWGHDELAFDTRWAYGVPPRSEPELAWAQHALAHLAEGGLAVLLLPPATASRSSGRRLRAELLRHGAARAVIALPAGVAVPHHIGLHLWILQRPDGGPRQDTVLLMDASDESAKDERGLRDAVLAVWHAFAADPARFAELPGTARAVSAIGLLDELVDLSPARHVRTAPVITPDAAAGRVADLVRRLRADVAELSGASDIGPLPPAAGAGRTWRTATVADLARGGALSVLRGTPASSGALPEALAGRRVLRARDLLGGTAAGGDPHDPPAPEPVVIEAGDVLLAQVAGAREAATRVADAADAGCLLGVGVYLLRPDPARLDPWFLAGFAGAADNVSQATTGTSAHQLSASRLRVPLLPPDEQTAYGRAFRLVHRLRTAARRTTARATETADLLSVTLTGGTLLPPDTPEFPA